jgi:hypothetical protein
MTLPCSPLRRHVLAALSLLATVALVGCATESTSGGELEGALALEAAPVPPSGAFGLHHTCWHESEGDEGPIPYRTIDIQKNGTFVATIEAEDPRAEPAQSWIDAHPGADVHGTWTLTNETLSSGHTYQAITFVEEPKATWIYDLENAAVAHTFKVAMKAGDGDGEYTLAWDNAYYENPSYLPAATTCPPNTSNR